MASLQGAKAWIGDKFARLHAYIKSVPPDVWLGLAIGAGVLILAWLAYRKSQGSSSSGSTDGTVTTSTDTPVIPDTSVSGTNNIIPSLFGPGGDDNSGHISGIFQQQQTAKPGPVAWLLTPRAQQQGIDVAAAARATAAKANAAAARLAPSQAFSAEHAPVYNPLAAAAKKAPSQAFAAEHAAPISHPLANLASAFAAEHRPVAPVKPPTGRRQDIALGLN